MRSTQVRTSIRTVITIPNAELAAKAVENFGTRDRLLLEAVVQLRYETTPDQLRFLLARLRQILLAHPRITDTPARARFVGFRNYSLEVQVVAYVDTSDWGEFVEIREDIYLRFMDAVKEAGTRLAIPSSRTYLGRDEKLDEEAIRQAEAQVDAWRDNGEFPFPRFPADVRERLNDTLEWPPLGSPDGPPVRRE